MFRYALLIALIAPLGCADAAGPEELNPSPSQGAVAGVGLSVSGTSYSHGDTLEVRLVNGGAENVGYNLCSSWRERETEDGWERIESFRMCTAELLSLPPGQTASWREPVDPEWGSGRYRVVTRVWPGGRSAAVALATNPFAVAP
ncbi:MAG: hypothetical protein WD766_14065 [Gemmatimonadota bacterium]